MKRGGGQGNAKSSSSNSSSSNSSSSNSSSSKSSSSKSSKSSPPNSSMGPQGEMKKSPPIDILRKKSVIYNQKQENLLDEGRLQNMKMMVQKQQLETEAKRIEESAKKIQALQRGRKTRKRADYIKRKLDEEPQDNGGYWSSGEEYATNVGKIGKGITEFWERKRRKSFGGGTKKKRRRRKSLLSLFKKKRTKRRKKKNKNRKTRRKTKRKTRKRSGRMRRGNYTQRSPLPRQVRKAFRNR